MIEIVSALPEDLEYVALNLRSEDAQEIETSTGMTDMVEAMKLSAKLSREVYAVFPILDDVQGKPIAIFGVTDDPRHPGVGVCWLLSTPMLFVSSRDILKEAPKWLHRWIDNKYASGLHNVIDQRNKRHVEWCKRAGFRFLGVRMLNGFPFLHAYLPPKCAVQSH